MSILAVLLIAAVGLVLSLNKSPIKIGVMHSLTGHMAESEKSIVDALLFAVDEINAKGGINGQMIIPIVKDGRSDPDVFVRIAEELILQDEVDVVFGCWTSSCRKSVLPVFEKHNHLLYYSLQYEGLESSNNIIYLGAVPNQNMIPALEWSLSKRGKKIYLVGSDYVFPRAANAVIREQSLQWRGEIVGEQYLPLGAIDFRAIVEDIKKQQPDVIFNTINGHSNLEFFKSLRAAGITASMIPTISFSISEDELSQFKGVDLSGDILVWNYLQGLDNALNKQFVSGFHEKYGSDRRIGNPMVTAYTGLHLWAKAVRKAGSSKAEKVRPFASDLSIHGPGGMIYIEAETHHSWKSVHIARINENNSLESIWDSKVPIAPQPYPETRTVLEWQAFLQYLKISWTGKWQATPDSI
ncbi:MAG: urea ABC transporter substrate-binding protein [Pseudomonadales bacterium]|nr:urea ABC transporter substrate-binding protein [Pseudomonadales bacterium]